MAGLSATQTLIEQISPIVQAGWQLPDCGTQTPLLEQNASAGQSGNPLPQRPDALGLQAASANEIASAQAALLASAGRIRRRKAGLRTAR